MTWLIENIFNVIGLVGATASSIWICSSVFYKLDFRIQKLETNHEKLESKLNDEIKDLHHALDGLRLDIKELLAVVMKMDK